MIKTTICLDWVFFNGSFPPWDWDLDLDFALGFLWLMSGVWGGVGKGVYDVGKEGVMGVRVFIVLPALCSWGVMLASSG